MTEQPPARGRNLSVDPAVSMSRTAPRAAIWLPGLLVALGAAVATAHGLYAVTRAAGAPPVIAGLYPLITDGLALVAYTATTQLPGTGRRYAWAVVVLAAGLSGLAQASYLAGGVNGPGTDEAGQAGVSAALRFGVGAWPAIAAAIVAHLLFLLTTDGHHTAPAVPATGAPPVHRLAVQPGVQPTDTGVQPAAVRTPVQSPEPGTVAPTATVVQPPEPGLPGGSGGAPARVAPSPARDRAERLALAHRARHGALPTVSQLVAAAGVSRGTAGETLKDLRSRNGALHVIRSRDETSHP